MNTFMKNIKVNSQNLHDVAENTWFLKRLVDGNASVEGYSEYLFNLYEIYKTIEFNLEKYSDNPSVKEFATIDVYRSEAIYKDLKILLGEKMNSMKLLASTKAYVDKLNEVGRSNPELLVAHAYSRYLADLFGGRTIYKILENVYKVDYNALNYYQYEALNEDEGRKDFIMEYYTKLNNIELSDVLKEKFLDEVSNSYIYNIAISNELDYIKYCK
ncbi:MAG: biliverdin-producing heme oxygenase [Clostridium sp.]|uniref:biliverdin-producing heme oxygenase n=1 Tax=Clostridium sp. TaxID=1506 RepID=UPI002FC8726E